MVPKLRNALGFFPSRLLEPSQVLQNAAECQGCKASMHDPWIVAEAASNKCEQQKLFQVGFDFVLVPTVLLANFSLVSCAPPQR